VKHAILLLSFFTTAAFAQMRVEDPWARATAPGAKVGAAYMRITGSAADRLVGASSPAAARVELHITSKEGEVMRMREVKAYDIPAKGGFTLAPGGAHLMLVDLKAPLKEGAKVPLVLRFEKSGEVKIELQVRALTSSGHGSHSH
jgi:periplasmic copper chaperone A